MLIAREFGFDMGHCLPDHQGACYRPHGHRYRLEVTIDGDVQQATSERGMVMDFARFKRIVERQIIERFDHRFMMSYDDPRLAKAREAFPEPRDVLAHRAPPTVENLVVAIAELLEDDLPLVEVTLWETPTCWATWLR